MSLEKNMVVSRRQQAIRMTKTASRRTVLKGVLLGAAGVGLTTCAAPPASDPASQKAKPVGNTNSRKDTMNIFFNTNALFEEQSRRTLYNGIYGGADFGECFLAAQGITEGDAGSWYRGWSAVADRVAALGDESAARGRRVSAREAYLRASNYYRNAYLMLYGAPVDPRLVEASDKENAAFLKAAALFDPPIEPIEIPFEGTTLPGYFYVVDDSGAPRPTVICTNGYDSTINEMHFAHAVAATRRGYNVLLFDGPGQGRPLIKQNLYMRPDWENVVRPVVDYALTRPEVDARRVALIGWSLGGYLAPRAAGGEHRLAACIADPGLPSLWEGFRRLLADLPPGALDHLPDLDPAVLQPLMKQIEADPNMRWKLIQRGLWVHGVKTLGEYLKVSQDFDVLPVAGRIRCHTLLTQAENDPAAKFAGELYDALTGAKSRTLMHFTNAEGAGDHVEAAARTLYHQRSFDWLDDVLGR